MDFFSELRPLLSQGLIRPILLGSLVPLLALLVSSLLGSRTRASLQRATVELDKRASTDPLTELPNRISFEHALADAARRADARHGRMAVLAVNLDGFTNVNEVYGHENGDRMLREVAARLRVMMKAEDVVARLGADEFLILVDGNSSSDEVAALAATVLDVVCRPCSMNGREEAASCSIGIAMYPEHGATTALIAHAETALRSAKRAGGETFCFFDTRMLNDAREHVDLLRDLRRALAQNEFELVYQPKVGAMSGLLTGAEALIRWRHPQRGVISPALFIPIAERFGLIGAIGDWVIDEACRQSRAWMEAGLRLRLSVNLSIHQLRRSDLPEYVAGALSRNRVDPDLLICEITESAAMEDPEGTMAMFKRLGNVGVGLSIDDFGTGYSSLAYLRKLSACELKIDRSFVLDLETSADACAVVNAVVRLAQALGLKVVAEGVETPGQRDILKALGCDELQGFLFAKPMSAKALTVWAIEDWRPDPPMRQMPRYRARAPLAVVLPAAVAAGVVTALPASHPRSASH